MDDLLKSAVLYQELQNFEYRFLLGRKGRMSQIILVFDESHFFHLLGMHKLIDLVYIKRLRSLEHILKGNISLDDLRKSKFYQSNFPKHVIGIEDRVHFFPNLAQMLDENDLIFHYNSKVYPSSKIEAEYLLEYRKDTVPLYLFLNHTRQNDKKYFCQSFFPKSPLTWDYTFRQTRMTLLYKEKYDKTSGVTTVLYTRLREAPTLWRECRMGE